MTIRAGLFHTLAVAAALVLPGCTDDEAADPRYLIDESFEGNLVINQGGWRGADDPLAVRRVPSDCPDGGAWALRLETGVGERPSGRVDIFHDLTGLEDGDLLILTAWMRRDSEAGYGHTGFCIGESDVIRCIVDRNREVRSAEWVPVTWFQPVHAPEQFYYRVRLAASAVPAGEAAILVDRVQVRRVPGLGGDSGFFPF
jgi:hypothetical protein